jgi:hypothetical protein
MAEEVQTVHQCTLTVESTICFYSTTWLLVSCCAGDNTALLLLTNKLLSLPPPQLTAFRASMSLQDVWPIVDLPPPPYKRLLLLLLLLLQSQYKWLLLPLLQPPGTMALWHEQHLPPKKQSLQPAAADAAAADPDATADLSLLLPLPLAAHLAHGPVRLQEVWLEEHVKQVACDALNGVVNGQHVHLLAVLDVSALRKRTDKKDARQNT